MFPVESGFERDLLNLILQVRWSVRQVDTDLAIEVVKPLFDLTTRLGPCRPDFVLEVTKPGKDKKALIVEAMGFDTPEYEAAKAITLPRMQLIGPIFPIRPEHIRPANLIETSKSLTKWVQEQAAAL